MKAKEFISNLLEDAGFNKLVSEEQEGLHYHFGGVAGSLWLGHNKHTSVYTTPETISVELLLEGIEKYQDMFLKFEENAAHI